VERRGAMNPGGPIEEAGSTARTLVTSLASTPVILALVVFNLFYIGMTTWLQIKQSERFTDNQTTWAHMVEKTMELCRVRLQ
jgi:hypothetical protein